MTDYLIMPGDETEHYFYKPYEGICCRTGTKDREQIIENASGAFSVYASSGGSVHLICVNDENKLIYAAKKQGSWKKYVLATLSSDIFVSEMRLYRAGSRLNLLYSALFGGETLLIHCILGDHAKPSTVDTLETSHFFVHGKRAYYTNAKGELGYVSLADEKPSGFNKLYDDAHCCTVYTVGGKEFMLFTRDSKLFLNGSELLYDSRIEMPVFVPGTDRMYIMWKSGGFVRYVTSFNRGTTWSEAMRFMSTGSAVTLYNIQRGDSFGFCYGFKNANEIKLLGKPELFTHNSYDLPQGAELEKLKTMLDSALREVSDAKKEISRLGKALAELTQKEQ